MRNLRKQVCILQAICDIVDNIIDVVYVSIQDDPTYQTSSDVKSQLRVFEQIDEIERRKREAREREVLIRAAKVKYFSPSLRSTYLH